MKDSVKTLFFDLDDTIYDAEGAYAAVLKRMATLFTPDEFKAARETVKVTLGPGQVCARNRLLYFKQLLRSRGVFKPTETLEWMKKYETFLHEEISNQMRALHRPELLKALTKKFKLYLVTNENCRTQLIKLQAIDPAGQWFSDMVTSEEAGVEKPNKKIFETALQIAKVSPADVLFVGDTWDGDMAPALSLGMHVCLTSEFRNEEASLKKGARVTAVKKLDELEGLLL